MKNKNNTYLLIGALLLIWGFIGYKMVFNLDKNTVTTGDMFVTKKKIIKIEIDSFLISTDYRDPFHLKYKKKKEFKNNAKVNSNKQKKKPIQKKAIQKKINISHIKYYGTIKNSSTSKIVGVIYINKQELLISNGTEIVDGRIISISENKVSLMYKEQIFEIVKE